MSIVIECTHYCTTLFKVAQHFNFTPCMDLYYFKTMSLVYCRWGNFRFKNHFVCKLYVPLNFLWLWATMKDFNWFAVLFVKKWKPMSELATFEAITHTSTFGPLLWEKFYHVKGSQQTVEIDMQWLSKGEVTNRPFTQQVVAYLLLILEERWCSPLQS